MDPDPGILYPDPAMFVIDVKDTSKNLYFMTIFFIITF